MNKYLLVGNYYLEVIPGYGQSMVTIFEYPLISSIINNLALIDAGLIM